MARVRFGTFDFDPATGELRREGTIVRLQAQPARVLALLIDHCDEIVTRDALRDALWGTETFVDFDRGLNFCIAQIRSALGDSATSPRFVRTLPKRGYQFIAPVSQTDVVEPGEPEPDSPTGRQPFLRVALLVVVLVVAALAAWRWRSAPPALRVAVARFDNETNDPGLDRFADGLTDSVVAELTAGSGGAYGVIGNAAILRLPRSQRDLLAIGRSLNARFVILGQVQRNATRIRVLAHLIRLPEQTHLWVTRIDRTVDDPLSVESEIAKQIGAEFSRRIASPQAVTR